MVFSNLTVLRREHVRDRVIVNFSNFRRRASAIVAAGILAGTMGFGASDAQATIFTWHVEGDFGYFDPFTEIISPAEIVNGASQTGGTFQYDSELSGAAAFINFDIAVLGSGIFETDLIEFDTVDSGSGATSLLLTSTAIAGNSLLIEFLSSGFIFGELHTSGSSGYSINITSCTTEGCVNNEPAFNIELYSTAPVSSVPVPAALPLFGTGLAIMGFLGWRRKSKAAAA